MPPSKKQIKFSDVNQTRETYSATEYDRKKIMASMSAKPLKPCNKCPPNLTYDPQCTGNPRSSKGYPCRDALNNCYDCEGEVSVLPHSVETLAKSQSRQPVQSKEQRDERRELAKQRRYELQHKHDMVFRSVQYYIMENQQFLELYQGMFDSFAGMIEHIKKLDTTDRILIEAKDFSLAQIGKMLLDSI